jgi:leucyl aminopeptidase
VKRVQLAAVAVCQPDDHLVILAEKDRLDQLAPALSEAEFLFLTTAVQREVANFFFPRPAGSVFVRVLKPEKDAILTAEAARLAGNELLRELRQYKIDAVTLRNTCSENRALDFAEGLALGSYQFLKYYSDAPKKENPLHQIRIEQATASEEAVQELNHLLEAVFLSRDLVNEPHSHFTALDLAAAAEAAAAAYGFSVDVLEEEQLASIKMGGLLAVNQASDVPPRFCILEWNPPGARNNRPVVLVGKGVVYDTGGLSLKPSEGMDYMKCDMAGAAAVIGVFAAVAQNKLPIHLIGLIPATDNKIGKHAIGPGDVIRMYSGKSVEVVNTDAEGRLILADALHYARKFDPELVLDLATLTGAAVKALGTQAICYMGTASETTKKALEGSGMTTYERLVEFPLWKEFGDELKSSIADLRNVGSGNAGMITAGKFLEHFADYPWLHLDIAGPAYLRTANGYRTKDGTGVGVRLLYHFLKNH